MTQIMGRLNRELESFGRRAQAALDEGRLQIELLRLRRQQDTVARDLGLLVHRRERGTDVEQRRMDALLLRLDDLESDIARLTDDIAARRRARSERDAVPEPPVAAHS